MVFDHALVSTCDKDEVLDPCLPRLVHDVLDERPVDDREHLFWHCFGRGQKAGSQPGDGENGFADMGHARIFSVIWVGKLWRPVERHTFLPRNYTINAAEMISGQPYIWDIGLWVEGRQCAKLGLF